MANLRVSDLSAITTIANTGDLVHIIDITDTTYSPAGTDKKLTVASLNTYLAQVAQTFTNKTLDTAGAGNVLKINGTQVSAVTGTGSVVLQTSPTINLTAGVINVGTGSAKIGPASTTTRLALDGGSDVLEINNVTQIFISSASPQISLFNASDRTLQIINTGGGKANLEIQSNLVLDGSSSGSTKLAAAATASGTLTLPAATDTLVGKATTDILTNKTLDTPVVRNWDGWEDANESWAYASATTITVPTGAASKYKKGDKIKLTQTTVKYFYIVGVADTLLTITGGSDYTLANAAISANFYSHAATPIGFPDWFNFSPANTGFSSDPGFVYAKFRLDSAFCQIELELTLGTSNATTWTITGLPLTYNGTPSNLEWLCMCVDNGSIQTNPGIASFESAGTTLSMFKAGKTAWTNTNTKGGYHVHALYPY